MKPVRIAILGVTGAVGQEFLNLLAERNFPVKELRPLASARSLGKKIIFQGKEITIREAREDSFEGIDLVLSSAGGSISKRFVPAAVRAGAVVVDNTSAFRMDPRVPLVIPEINAADIEKHEGIIANPNCSTIIMLVPIFPMHRVRKIRRIVADTYQAVSGAGAKAMRELETQTRQVLEGQEPVKEVFPHQIAFNLFSHNSPLDREGWCEEEQKMIRETKKIFHDETVEVIPTTVRVPVMRAHSEAIYAEFEEPWTREELVSVLKKAPGVKVIDDTEKNYFPMPIDASGRDEILVGRIRLTRQGEGVSLFVSGDQLRKGAALNAVQIAERLEF